MFLADAANMWLLERVARHPHALKISCKPSRPGSIGIMVSNNIDLEWLSSLWPSQNESPVAGLMPMFDGQLILGDITIISEVSCTTLLMVCIFFLPATRTWSGNGADIPKEDSRRSRLGRRKGLTNLSYDIGSTLFVAWQSMAMIESKLLPWMFEA